MGLALGPPVHHPPGPGLRAVAQPPPPGPHRHHRDPAAVPRQHLDLPGPAPTVTAHPHPVHAGVAMAQCSTSSTRCDRWAWSPSPPVRSTANRTRVRHREAVLVARHRLHHHRPVVPGQPSELLGHQCRLEGPLPLRGPRAASRSPRTARAGVGAGWRHPAGGGLHDVDGIGPEEGGGDRRHLGHHQLAGEGVADEHHPAVLGPGHAAPAGGDGPGPSSIRAGGRSAASSDGVRLTGPPSGVPSGPSGVPGVGSVPGPTTGCPPRRSLGGDANSAPSAAGPSPPPGTGGSVRRPIDPGL